MNKPIKNILVYADGRTEEVQHVLEGHYFIQDERGEDGSLWERAFEVDIAGTPDAYSFIGLERSFVMKKSAAEYAKWEARLRAETMGRVLSALRQSKAEDE